MGQGGTNPPRRFRVGIAWLAWRGAVLFFIMFGGLIPFGSFVNCLWAGAILVVNFTASELGLSEGSYIALSAALLFIGLAGVWLDIRTMANRPVVRAMT